MTNSPSCALCGHRAPWLGEHIRKVHGSIEAYLAQHPKAPLASPEFLARLREGVTERQHPPDLDELTRDFAGVEYQVNAGVPPEACLPLPEAYRIPQFGPLAADVKAASLALKNARSLYIHGTSGCGKDGFVSAWSALHRVPGEEFQIKPNTDLQPWLWSKSISREGTGWEEGRLLRLARDGYATQTGRVVPALILITDFDRGTKSQVEIIRLLLDTIAGRIPRPDGGSWPVLPGTRFVVTANTAGQGDETGRYVSTNILDSSLLSRFQRKLQFHLMDWRDEEPILREKFPLFASKMGHELTGVRDQNTGNLIRGLGIAVQTLREQIARGNLYGEFSHREVCNWVQAAEDFLREHPRRKAPKYLMRSAARYVFDGYSDEETRLSARRLIHGHITDGLLETHEDEAEEGLAI